MSIKVGVIGTGYLGQHHARIYSEIEGVKLTALIDIDKKRAEELASKYKSKAYSNYKDIIKSLDAVNIVTPTISHYEIALACLRLGKDVLVEKPITFDVAQADCLINEAEKNKCILQVGHIERYNPALIKASEIIKKPLYLESRRYSPFTGRGTDVDITLDLMIHDIDIILSLVPSPVKEIRANGQRLLTDKIDFANAWLEFENRTSAFASVSRVSTERQRMLTVFEKDSYTIVDYQNLEVKSYFNDNSKLSADALLLEKKEPLREELIDFLCCVTERKKPKVSGVEGRDALKIVLDITEKIKHKE
ncbi:MAG: Gfo/Idh/MocA family oxidoreductase [Nitrospiraceae bacterium]|nr:Gfo/Idh/MocA family oxidoreductase [Nitrospiraceae bacterium]